jgi:hypothetical protein
MIKIAAGRTNLGGLWRYLLDFAEWAFGPEGVLEFPRRLFWNGNPNPIPPRPSLSFRLLQNGLGRSFRILSGSEEYLLDNIERGFRIAESMSG